MSRAEAVTGLWKKWIRFDLRSMIPVRKTRRIRLSRHRCSPLSPDATMTKRKRRRLERSICSEPCRDVSYQGQGLATSYSLHWRLSIGGCRRSRHRRLLERSWQSFGSEKDRKLYRHACQSANKIIQESRRNHSRDNLSDCRCRDNQGKHWNIVEELLHNPHTGDSSEDLRMRIRDASVG